MADKDAGEMLEKVIEENSQLKKEVEYCEKMIRVLSKRNIAMQNRLDRKGESYA